MHLARRTTFIAALMAAPAVAAAVGLSAIEVLRFVSPESPLFGDPKPASLAEAIARRSGVEHAYAFIRAGQDPNEPVVVDDPDYTGGRSIRVSPLMLAVAARDSSVVLMLFNFGARLDLPQNRLAPCLAQDLGDTSVAGILARERGFDEPPRCPTRQTNATPPLVKWME